LHAKKETQKCITEHEMDPTEVDYINEEYEYMIKTCEPLFIKGYSYLASTHRCYVDTGRWLVVPV
jgi:hypothetical protein